MKCLIVNGANIDAKTNDESTPLSFAAFYNKGRGRGPEIVKCLIENGADIGAKDIYQQTPLHLAIAKFENCSSEMIKKYLIINGCLFRSKR